MRFVYGLIALIAMIIFLGAVAEDSSRHEMKHEEVIADIQSETVLHQSIGKIAEAMDQLALSMQEMAIANQKQSEAIQQMNANQAQYNNRVLTVMSFVIFLLSLFIVALGIGFVKMWKKDREQL